MKRYVLPALLLALAMTLPVLTACQGNGSSKFVGTYQAVLPSATTDGWRVTLALDDDGTATLTNDYMDGNTPVVDSGTWNSSGDTATVILTQTGEDSGGQEVKITFELHDDRLFVVNFVPEDFFPSVGLQLKKQ